MITITESHVKKVSRNLTERGGERLQPVAEDAGRAGEDRQDAAGERQDAARRGADQYSTTWIVRAPRFQDHKMY